jgi:hypothetical protein
VTPVKRSDQERAWLDARLDRELQDTFPASDAPSIVRYDPKKFSATAESRQSAAGRPRERKQERA